MLRPVRIRICDLGCERVKMQCDTLRRRELVLVSQFGPPDHLGGASYADYLSSQSPLVVTV